MPGHFYDGMFWEAVLDLDCNHLRIRTQQFKISMIFHWFPLSGPPLLMISCPLEVEQKYVRGGLTQKNIHGPHMRIAGRPRSSNSVRATPSPSVTLLELLQGTTRNRITNNDISGPGQSFIMAISVARRLLYTAGAAGICLFHVPGITAIEEPDCTQTVSIRWASSTDR